MTAHPLAVRLVEHLRGRPEIRVLELASGSGRNSRALGDAGFTVAAIDDGAAASPDPFAGITGEFSAALSTHGLLHGTPAMLAGRLSQIAGLLQPDGLLFATFGSVLDARFGAGQRIADFTYAPDAGDERGVPHAFFDRTRLTALLEPHFSIESLEEHGVDEVAGPWAHAERPLTGAAHWFAIATVR